MATDITLKLDQVIRLLQQDSPRAADEYALGSTDFEFQRQW
jgi:hypothetical protein